MNKSVFIKTAIATAICAATTATAIADTKLYGRFRAGVVCTDGAGDTDCGLENRSSRFGIKASNEITDGLTAFGRYEFEVRLDEGSIRAKDDVNNAARRLSYVGVKGGFGEISVGSRWTPMYNYVASPVDPFQLLGGTWGPTYQSTFRKADTVNYKNAFGSTKLHVQLQMDDGDVGNDAIDELQIGGSFKLGSANIGLVYRDVTDGNSEVGVHGGTKLGPIGLGLSYIGTSVDGGDDVDTILGLADYGLGGGKKVSLSFGQNMVDNGPEPTMIGVEYEHKLSKRYRWFAAVENTDNDDNTDDTLRYGVGMRLEF